MICLTADFERAKSLTAVFAMTLWLQQGVGHEKDGTSGHKTSCDPVHDVACESMSTMSEQACNNRLRRSVCRGCAPGLVVPTYPDVGCCAMLARTRHTALRHKRCLHKSWHSFRSKPLMQFLNPRAYSTFKGGSRIRGCAHERMQCGRILRRGGERYRFWHNRPSAALGGN